jgi:hypothetical protein
VDRSRAALIVVIFDLLLAFTMWFAMVMLKPILKVTEEEIDKNAVTPSDFSVIIKCPKVKTPIETLPALYWTWVDNIMSGE